MPNSDFTSLAVICDPRVLRVTIGRDAVGRSGHLHAAPVFDSQQNDIIQLRSGGAAAARLAHNQEAEGASPSPATITVAKAHRVEAGRRAQQRPEGCASRRSRGRVCPGTILVCCVSKLMPFLGVSSHDLESRRTSPCAAGFFSKRGARAVRDGSRSGWRRREVGRDRRRGVVHQFRIAGFVAVNPAICAGRAGIRYANLGCLPACASVSRSAPGPALTQYSAPARVTSFLRHRASSSVCVRFISVAGDEASGETVRVFAKKIQKFS